MRLEKDHYLMGPLSSFFPAQAEEVLDSRSSDFGSEESLFQPTFSGDGLIVTGIVLLSL